MGDLPLVGPPRARRPGDAPEVDLAAREPARRRVRLLGLRRGAGYGLLTAALVVLTASVFLSFSRIKENHEAALATTGVSLWIAFQADYELQRLLSALDRYALDPAGPVGRDELRERFDIFWSRLPLLVQGADSSAIKRVSPADALVPELLAELRALEPALIGLRPGDRGAAYAELRRRLARFERPLRELALEVNQTLGREHTALHRRLEALYSGHVLYLLGILGSAGVFIFLLVRESVAARRHLAAATLAQAQVEHLAHHDPLTDLPNRVVLHDRLRHALARARRDRRKVAVHYLDLDRFKEVNDTLGHAVGDALLVAAAGRMLGCVREADTLARLGGDEFAVVQADLADADGAAALARRLTEALRAEPLTAAGHDVAVGASIGVTLFPDDADDAAQLLTNADLALYRAKADGRDAVRFYSGDMNRRVQARRRLERDLRRALEAGALELHYQPKFRLADRRLVGMEALLRWTHPAHGAVPPAEFIRVAEESGLIVPLGDWVLGAACRQNRAWQAAGLRPVRVAVNLSPAQFASRNLVGAVRRILAEGGLAPRHLELEITEGVLLHDTERTLATLDQLRGLGVHLSLDDFGTGYSSLNYLLRFRFDSLKIDRSFVHGLGAAGDGESILRAVVTLAHSLNMAVVAEGAETAEQLARLEALGCDVVQGFHLGAPEPAAAFEARLRRPELAATA